MFYRPGETQVEDFEDVFEDMLEGCSKHGKINRTTMRIVRPTGAFGTNGAHIDDRGNLTVAGENVAPEGELAMGASIHRPGGGDCSFTDPSQFTKTPEQADMSIQIGNVFMELSSVAEAGDIVNAMSTRKYDGRFLRFVSVDENRFWDKIVSNIQEMVIPE